MGMIEPRIGLRLARMMKAGNRYSAAMVSTGEQPKVILRETFKHPSMIDKVSFPQSRLSEIRAVVHAAGAAPAGRGRGVGLRRGRGAGRGDGRGLERDRHEDIDSTPDVDVEAEDESYE
ncbi:hypothetical protein O0235_10755 [Tepidiforma flava]|uniref:Uncharacterized protein n=1 Tax=Tepidiforma flava TaxID=3004094 RepID=A0ABY7M4H5_9CHLR|nr:hypothetical protein [Tepidiforma flava]WBL35265.1 hypothetical protein O0235_10755 [Tepidiforma flava]